VDYLKADLALQEQGVPALYGIVAELAADLRPTTCSRLTWPTRRKTSTGARSRVQLIELIGRQNWLVKQL
jgi:bacterioferritin